MEEEQFNATYKDGFAGDRRFFKGFLAKIELVFMLYPERFNDDSTKVIYIISRLYGTAMTWAASLIENHDPCLNNYDSFIGKMKSFFGNNDATFIANQKLRSIKQKRLGDIRNYIIEFNRYADESSWNEEAKMDAFLNGLNEQIATRILEMFPGPSTLSRLQTIASRIDCRIFAHRQFFNNNRNYSNNRRNNSNNNKRSNFNKRHSNQNKKFKGPLSKEEKDRRRRENLCLYCGSADHLVDNCPLIKKNLKNNTHITNLEDTHRPRVSDQPNTKLPIYEFSLHIASIDTKAKILLDSGSQLNLIDIFFVKKHNIPYSTSTNLPKVSGIGGNQDILGKTLPISLQYKNHKCLVQFYVVDLPSYCAILGTDWLASHNPTINFSKKELSFDSNYCTSNCLVLPTTFTTHCTPGNNST